MSARHYGEMRCLMCRKRMERRGPTQLLCGAIECKRAYGRRWWRLHKDKYPGHDHCGPKPKPEWPGLPNLRCGCGEKLLFGSDPYVGTSIEYCPRCGERRLQLYGRRIHVQDSEAE